LKEFDLEVRVTPRPGLLDPEGNAIKHALESLGYDEVKDVRVGKAIFVTIAAESESEAIATAETMSRKLLANPVTEDFSVSIANGAGV
jgi:phosphoribosylformylglycinamidine synthase PurS subunit